MVNSGQECSIVFKRIQCCSIVFNYQIQQLPSCIIISHILSKYIFLHFLKTNGFVVPSNVHLVSKGTYHPNILSSLMPQGEYAMCPRSPVGFFERESRIRPIVVHFTPLSRRLALYSFHLSSFGHPEMPSPPRALGARANINPSASCDATT